MLNYEKTVYVFSHVCKIEIRANLEWKDKTLEAQFCCHDVSLGTQLVQNRLKEGKETQP